MKKAITIISLIILIVVVSTTLFACSSATTQGQLQNILNDHGEETFEYDVYSAQKDSKGNYTEKTDLYSGTYKITLKSYNATQDVPWANDSEIVADADGILVCGELKIGSITYKTGCYFNIIGGSYYMIPAQSYRVHLDGETETFKLLGTYNGKEFNYTRSINGKKESGTVEASGTLYYDNNEFHQALRTISTFTDSLTYSFSVPLVSQNEATSVSLTASVSGTTHVKTPYTNDKDKYQENGIVCYKTYISRSTEVAGVSQILYYAVEDIQNETGWNMKHVLVKIEEPFKHDDTECAMVYELKTANLA